MNKLVPTIRTWGLDGRPVGSGQAANPGPAELETPRADVSRHVACALAGQTVSVPVGEGGEEHVFSPLYDEEGKVSGAVSFVAEAGGLRATQTLRERLAFEELVTDLSSRFVSLSSRELDAALEDALGVIGEFSGVDRVYIFRFTSGGSAMDNTHEWCAPGIEPQKDALQGLSLTEIPWWSEQLKARQVIHVADVDFMPKEAVLEEAVLRAQDVQSTLAIPMVSEHAVVGFIGFDAVRKKKTWRRSDIALLRIVGEIFSGALERARAELDRKRLEVHLIQARSLENVARLAGGVAHDFNNLLAVILNYAVLLKRAVTEPGPREMIDELFDTARRAAELTRQLLLVGRRDVVQPVLVDPSSVITSLETLVTQTVGESIDVRLELGEDLELVRVGLPQLERVIVNLVLNARDAMPRGGTLTIRTEDFEITPEHAARYIDVHEGRYVRVEMRDDGIGMTPEVAARAFEPFFTTKGTRGTGLGLSTVYGIVKQAGGHVALSSEAGVGTVVDVFLPVAEEAAGASAITPEVSEPSDEEAIPLGRGETVLVVDDSAQLRKLVCAMLAENGYQVIEAATPAEAITACERVAGAIDVVVTDVVMPRMSGRELAETLRAAHGIDKVLYMSGYDNDVIVHHGFVEEGTTLLPKPFLEADLLRAVRGVLDRPSARSSAD